MDGIACRGVSEVNLEKFATLCIMMLMSRCKNSKELAAAGATAWAFALLRGDVMLARMGMRRKSMRLGPGASQEIAGRLGQSRKV